MWKATIRFESKRVPVKLYAAVEDSRVHFRLLHEKDHAPVRQQMVDAASGEPVPREAQRRGVGVDKDTWVLLDPEELAALEPEPSRDINVEQVVERGALDERWFERPYYLGPDADDDAYFALAAALEESQSLLIARWVMRRKPYLGAIHASRGYLLLETLHYAGELVALDALRPPAPRVPDRREIELAEQLIAALEDEFDPADYRDEYSAAVRNMLEQKASGKLARFPAAKRQRRAQSLVADLEASLSAQREAAGGR